MQPPCLGACSSLTVPLPRRRAFCGGTGPPRPPVSCAAGGGKTPSRGKDNVWSVDNQRAAAEKARTSKHRRRRRPGGRRPSPPPSQGRRKGNDAGSRVLVSGAMLVEVETVLQTQVLMLLPSIYPPQVIRRLVSFFSSITNMEEQWKASSSSRIPIDCFS
jgi:ELMO domain-containing protein